MCEPLAVSMQLHGLVGAQLQRIEFKCDLGGVGIACQMACLLGLNDGPSQRGQPFRHDFGDAITYRPGPAIEFGCDGGKEAAAAEYFSLHMTKPAVAQLPKTG